MANRRGGRWSKSTARATKGSSASERRQSPGPDPDWSEWWSFDVRTPDLAGFVRLVLRPHHGHAWFWTYVASAGRAPVVIRDQAVPLPRGDALDVRTDGLWASLVCEAPFEHWSVALEGFAIELDPPGFDPVDEPRGYRVPLGLDLEWEGLSPAVTARGPGREGYLQVCAVHGQVLVADDVVEVTGTGTRDHVWTGATAGVGSAG